MKKIIFLLLLCIIISGCAIYRSKYFEPVNHDYYNGDDTAFRIDKFENWHITVNFFAYYGSSAYSDDNFYIWIDASTFDKEAYVYKDTSYRANIKSLKILHGEDLQNEIKIPKTKLSINENGKRIFMSNENRNVYISPDIKMLTVIIEMEFLDKENNSIVKKYVIPMKRNEYSSIGPPLD